MLTSAPAHPAPGLRKAGLRGTVVLMVTAWLVPFAVHLLPWSGDLPLGAHLLPMFWATFVAVYLYGAGVGLLVGLVAPLANLALTGLPAWRFLSVLSFELAIFALATGWAVRRAPRAWLLAPLGYIVAKLASTGLQSVTSVFGDIGAPLTFLSTSLAAAWAGLVVLTLINLASVRLRPPSEDWDEA
jgi:hypothetical protein